MGMMLAVIAVGGLWVVAFVLERLGVETHVAAALGAFVGVAAGVILARPTTSHLFPDLVSKADRNAAERLSRNQE
jgi:uncharacterized membrane protein YjjB (DUF3815 family)